MPKKQNPLTPEEQRKRFEQEVEKLISAGDFDPERAAAELEKLVQRQKHEAP